MVKIESVSIDIFHGELAQTPGLLLERFDDSCPSRSQFLVRRVDVRRKYPVHRRLEWAASSAKENRDVIARDGADIATWIQPTNLEAERIAVVPLRALHVLNRELWHGWGERRSRRLLIHDSLLSGQRPRESMHAANTVENPE